MDNQCEPEEGKKYSISGDRGAVFVDAVAGIAESEGAVRERAIGYVGLRVWIEGYGWRHYEG